MKCDWAYDNRACRRNYDFCLLFQTFIVHNILYHYAMAMQFSALSKYFKWHYDASYRIQIIILFQN